MRSMLLILLCTCMFIAEMLWRLGKAAIQQQAQAYLEPRMQATRGPQCRLRLHSCSWPRGWH